MINFIAVLFLVGYVFGSGAVWLLLGAHVAVWILAAAVAK